MRAAFSPHLLQIIFSVCIPVILHDRYSKYFQACLSNERSFKIVNNQQRLEPLMSSTLKNMHFCTDVSMAIHTPCRFNNCICIPVI